MATEIDSKQYVAEQGTFQVGPFELSSRLIVGSGPYENATMMKECLELSGAQCITVAVRRERLHDADGENLLDFIASDKYVLLPNTAGCFTSEEALRTLRLAREIGGWKLVKLEVLGDKKNLFPDMIETLK